MSHKKELIESLKSANCIKFGKFTLKSGVQSSLYVDLRDATKSVSLFLDLVDRIKGIIETEIQPESKAVSIVGVPYGVVPLAGAVAYACKLPYWPIRKESKGYGAEPTKDFPEGMSFVIVEDVMSTGSSIVDTIEKMDSKSITHVIVGVDRELGGQQLLSAKYPHVSLHALLKISELNLEQ